MATVLMFAFAGTTAVLGCVAAYFCLAYRRMDALVVEMLKAYEQAVNRNRDLQERYFKALGVITAAVNWPEDAGLEAEDMLAAFLDDQGLQVDTEVKVEKKAYSVN